MARVDALTVDGYDDAGALGAGGHQVLIQRGEQHVVTVLQAGDHPLADAELAGNLDLGCLADLREIHRVDPVHFLGVGVRCGDIGGELRVRQRVLQCVHYE